MNKINTIYNTLYSEFGPQGWWPVKNKYNKNNFKIPGTKKEQFEIILGAVLT
ncbi:endonuclease III domain-containing protein, partial [Candidatus Woesearchaeota archaeon]|nr:endonuclease III domain-containing protein [Candidatus Woesearchaeota archaeon]